MFTGPRFPVLAVLAGFLFVAGTAPTVAADDTKEPLPTGMFKLADPVPVDSLVRIGKLPNGMTYYIRKNGWPESRAAIRLAVNAGSVLEDDDQQGLAHLLEHMAFNGSEHFKPGELVRYLESIGSRFGPDLNAYTSFDETVYILDVPTSPDSLLDRGLLVMSDYAGRISLSDEEIEKERGVVLEEWRLGQGADERMLREQFPVLYHGSRYANRLPIGLPETIRNTPASRIRDFYEKWYRPERMAIVVVGDIDPARVENLIRGHFRDIEATPDLAPLPEYDVPPHAETLYKVTTDPEARYTSISLTWKHPKEKATTIGDYRGDLIESLIRSMLADRLDEISRMPDAPFLGGYGYFGTLGRTVETFNMGARVADGGTTKGLEALLVEAERLRRHGFGAAELERAKDNMRASYDRMYRERDKTENASFAREYVSNYLNGEFIPGIEAEYRYMQEFLPGITVEDLRKVIDVVIHEDNRVVLVEAPEKAGLVAPTEADLRAAVARAAETPVAAWIDTMPDRPLMADADKPAPGAITARRTIDAIGVTVLTLSNGVEVWLKPTDFKHDQILMNAFATGGASLASPEDYHEAVRVAGVLGETGIGGFKPVELEKLLAGKIVSGTPYVTNYTHGFNGSATPKDLETALQLTYLSFTQPTDYPEAFDVYRTRLRGDVANRATDPDVAFSDSVAAVNYDNHYMIRPLTPEQVEALDFRKTIEFYKANFSNAADFTFIFVGAFDNATIEPLLAQYLGSLPSRGKSTSAYVDRGYMFTSRARDVIVKKGVEPKSRTNVTYFANPGRDEMELYRTQMAMDILRIRLREILREEQSATYGVSVNFAHSQPWLELGLVSVGFGSSPENVKGMLEAAYKEIEQLKEEGPTAEYLQKVQEMQRRALELSEKQNGYWAGALQMALRMGWDPARIAVYRDRIDTLTTDQMREVYRTRFPTERRTRVTLVPEKEGAVTTGSRE
jgi:zinc protease